MIRVPNAASYAGMRFLEAKLGRKYGGSTGTCLFGAMQLAAEMADAGGRGSIVMVAGDPGDRYLDTYYDDAWLVANGYDIQPWLARLDEVYSTCTWASAASGTRT